MKKQMLLLYATFMLNPRLQLLPHIELLTPEIRHICIFFTTVYMHDMRHIPTSGVLLQIDVWDPQFIQRNRFLTAIYMQEPRL